MATDAPDHTATAPGEGGDFGIWWAHVRVYAAIGVTLLALTVFTVMASYWDLPWAAAIYVALLIAMIKGGLVAAYFMHLIDEKKIIYATLGLTFILFIPLMFFPLWTVGGNAGTSTEVEAPASADSGHH